MVAFEQIQEKVERRSTLHSLFRPDLSTEKKLFRITYMYFFGTNIRREYGREKTLLYHLLDVNRKKSLKLVITCCFSDTLLRKGFTLRAYYGVTVAPRGRPK